jgi:hypothetical protein
MNCRPRRLFQEIGQRIGINWFRQPRSQMIIVSLPQNRAPAHIIADLHSDVIVRELVPSVFIRRQ